MPKGKVDREPEEEKQEEPLTRKKRVNVPKVSMEITQVPEEVNERDIKELAELIYG